MSVPRWALERRRADAAANAACAAAESWAGASEMWAGVAGRREGMVGEMKNWLVTLPATAPLRKLFPFETFVEISTDCFEGGGLWSSDRFESGALECCKGAPRSDGR